MAEYISQPTANNQANNMYGSEISGPTVHYDAGNSHGQGYSFPTNEIVTTPFATGNNLDYGNLNNQAPFGGAISIDPNGQSMTLNYPIDRAHSQCPQANGPPCENCSRRCLAKAA